MKIRIQGDSVRFRLSQTEVTELVNQGETWSKCQFPTGELIYGLVTSEDKAMTCFFDNGKMTAKIPILLLHSWDSDDRVGFEAQADGLFILVEKDWQCLKPRANEDETNLYVNPQAL